MSDQKVAQQSQHQSDEFGRFAKKSKISQVASNANDGSSFRSKKAGGDVKKQGQHDPYSYLPLRKDMLNKRKKRTGGTSVPGLANIVKGAKKGVNRGNARNKKGGYKSKA